MKKLVIKKRLFTFDEQNDKTMENVIRLLLEINKSSAGVYRKFMTTDEVKICNKLVKEDMLYKGKPSEKNATIAFFITGKGSKFLEDYEQLNNG